MSALNDCFTASGTRMKVADALARFADGLEPAVEAERVATRHALGRILAENLIAPRTIPPHDNSAVDGYAVAFDDVAAEGETVLPVAATVAAGHPMTGAWRKGTALKVFTGAVLPEGPDTVYMLEDCAEDGANVSIPGGLKRGANRRRAGEDVSEGDIVIAAGTRLRAQEVGMAASLGYAELPVYARLKVAVFSTGDEVREPGTALDPGCIFDINRYALMSLLDGLGVEAADAGIFADNFTTIRDGIARAAEGHDLVITSGGVSMGDEDHVKAAVAELGAINFWNLAVKPGRPIALGWIGAKSGDVPFIGLPGNPVAAMVTFMRIARPILVRLAGGTDLDPATFQVPAGFDFEKKAGRREWLRARLARGADGHLVAHKFPEEGSGILTSMVSSDGIVELDEDRLTVTAGELVDFLPFSEVTR